MSVRSSILALALAAPALVVTDYSLAANPYKTPCTGDGKRLCHMQNQAKAEACLKQHLAEVTPACRTYLTKNKR